MNDTLCFDLKEFESICKNLKIPGFCSAVTELRDDPASWELSQMQWIMTALRHELTLRAKKPSKEDLKRLNLSIRRPLSQTSTLAQPGGLKNPRSWR